MSYTLFISGVSNPNSPDTNNKLNNVSAEEIVVVFDAVDNYTMSLSNEKTSFPIESRSQITDHVFSPDGKFSFTGRVTSSPLYVRQRVEWDKNTNPQNPKATTRIRNAYEVIKAARDSRSSVSLSTEEFDLTNYVITGFEFSREGADELGIFNLSLEEMRVRTVGTTVLATGVGSSGSNSSIKAGNPNQNKGSTQSGSVPDMLKRQDVTVRDTTNLTSVWTEAFKNENIVGSIPQDQTNKLELGK